ncbi:MAG: PIN domain-containing protein [Sulfuricurvum sp.]|nr:PIN domain-containing protein [Sulfuricurvum sp.]
MKYMLDTNICIYIINNKPAGVIERFMALDKNDHVCLSTITITELFFGLEKSQSLKKEQNRLAMITFLSQLEVVSFDENAAMKYGVIRAKLQKKGCVIGNNDMLIASHAQSINAVLVTNNEREFDRVEGLKVENWV